MKSPPFILKILGSGLLALAVASCCAKQLKEHHNGKCSDNPLFEAQFKHPVRLVVSNQLTSWNRLGATTEISDPAIIRSFVNVLTRTKKREPIFEYNHERPLYIVALDQEDGIIAAVVSDSLHMVVFPMKARRTLFGFVASSVDKPVTVGCLPNYHQTGKYYWGLPAKTFLSQFAELRGEKRCRFLEER